MASANLQTVADPDLIRLGIGLVIVVAGLWAVEQVNPKLGAPYIMVVLLGVLLTQRAGFEKFTAFVLAQTQNKAV